MKSYELEPFQISTQNNMIPTIPAIIHMQFGSTYGKVFEKHVPSFLIPFYTNL